MIKKSTKVFSAALSVALSAAIMMSSATPALAASKSGIVTNNTLTYSAASVSFPTIKEGTQGYRVKGLQYLLNCHVGAGLTINGKFDTPTKNAVKKFQNSRDIKGNGTLNAETWASLTNLVQSTSFYYKDATKAIQILLNNKIQAGLSVDGIYGNDTKKAVVKFQKSKDIDADGMVGPVTWKYLFS